MEGRRWRTEERSSVGVCDLPYAICRITCFQISTATTGPFGVCSAVDSFMFRWEFTLSAVKLALLISGGSCDEAATGGSDRLTYSQQFRARPARFDYLYPSEHPGAARSRSAQLEPVLENVHSNRQPHGWHCLGADRRK